MRIHDRDEDNDSRGVLIMAPSDGEPNVSQ
jgi:hypothetical protein